MPELKQLHAGHATPGPAIGARALLSDLPRRNCWTIAEWAGESPPNGMQHLLGRAKWDADAVRDDVRGYVVEHLRDDRRCWWSTRPAT